MNNFPELILTNTIIATILGLLVFGVTRIWRNPHLAHGLWLLVLVKLVTPPLFTIPLPILDHHLTVGEAEVPPLLSETPSALGESPRYSESTPPALPPRSVSQTTLESAVPGSTPPKAPPWLLLSILWMTGLGLLLTLGWYRNRRLRTIIYSARGR